MSLLFAVGGSGGGGGDLPDNQAIVANGQSFVAADGQTVTVAVAGNVPTFTVLPDPFWEPFTATTAALGPAWPGAIGYAAGDAGSITNQPVAGWTLTAVNTLADLFTLQISGPRSLRDDLFNAWVGINTVDFRLDDYDRIYADETGGVFLTTVEIPGVTAWTSGQQIPIVVLPQP